MPILSGNKQLQAAQLGNLGNRDFGDDVTLSNSAKTLVKIADVFIQDYKRRMQRSGNVATGKGSDLIKGSDIEINGTKLSIDIMVPKYLLYQSYGVNGTEKKHGSKYSYGKKMPPAADILKWVRRRALRADQYKSIKRTRYKAGMDKDRAVQKIRDEAKSFRSLAFAIARGIQKNGIKPTKDLQNAGKTIERVFKKELAAGFRLDIIESLKDGNSNQ